MDEQTKVTTVNRQALYRMALRRFGSDSQALKLMEEAIITTKEIAKATKRNPTKSIFV